MSHLSTWSLVPLAHSLSLSIPSLPSDTRWHSRNVEWKDSWEWRVINEWMNEWMEYPSLWTGRRCHQKRIEEWVTFKVGWDGWWEGDRVVSHPFDFSSQGINRLTLHHYCANYERDEDLCQISHDSNQKKRRKDEIKMELGEEKDSSLCNYWHEQTMWKWIK